MKAKITSVSAASFLILLGSCVMLGWLLHIPKIVQIIPGFVGMVFNTALLFTLIGLTLLFANFVAPSRYSFVLRSVGVFIVVFASFILSQHLFNYASGIDEWAVKPWIQDPNPDPGRMAPNTAVAFIISGIVIFFVPIHHKRIINVIVPLCIFIILLIALIGVLIYSLKLEYVFSWYNYTRMSLHAALGFILVSMALWCLVIQSPFFARIYEGNEERKILLISGAVLVILTLITGLGSIAISTFSSFDLIQQSFKDSTANKINIIENEINNQEKELTKIIKNKNFQQATLAANQKNTGAIVNEFALIFADNDLSVKVIGLDGKTLYEQGIFSHTPRLILPIKSSYNSFLIWDNKFLLRSQAPIVVSQNSIGKIVIEGSLPNINKFYSDYDLLGQTGENIICGYLTNKEARCFPSRFNKQPFNVNLTDKIFQLPLLYALQGKTGADNMMNYRKEHVVASYSPIGRTGLGLVVERNAEEVYQPINNLLLAIFPGSLFLIFLGLLLLRWQVIPLVMKVISAEKEATKNRIELEEIEKRYKIAVKSSNTGLWEWERSTNNFYPSDLFKQMLGYEKDEFPDTLNNFIEHIHPNDKEQIVALFSSGTRIKETFSIEYRVRNKMGEYGWFQTIGQVIEDTEGNTIGMAGSLLDITNRKKAEGLKNDFISVVSHELRTPLTSINGSLRLVLSGVMGSFSDKAANLLKIASNNCDRLVNLINDMLDVEKIESGKIHL